MLLLLLLKEEEEEEDKDLGYRCICPAGERRGLEGLRGKVMDPWKIGPSLPRLATEPPAVPSG